MVTKQRTNPSKSSPAKPGFVGDTISELKKVTWLSRREVAYLSGLVLVVTVIVGVFLGLVDFGFTRLIETVFLGR